jgi:hypothetical protein
VDDSAVVFEGIVIGKRVTIDHSYEAYQPTNEVTFAVLHLWKGDSVSRVKLIEDGSDCGAHFSGGQRYVVFADRHGSLAGRLTASVCSPTGPMNAARSAGLRRVLGPPLFSFPPPDAGELPDRIDEMRYVWSGYCVAGMSVVRNVIAHRSGVTGVYHRMAPVLVVMMGTVLVLAQLLVAALMRRRRTTSFALIGAAMFCGFLTLIVAGYAYAAHPVTWSPLRWTVPPSTPPPPSPPPRRSDAPSTLLMQAPRPSLHELSPRRVGRHRARDPFQCRAAFSAALEEGLPVFDDDWVEPLHGAACGDALAHGDELLLL